MRIALDFADPAQAARMPSHGHAKNSQGLAILWLPVLRLLHGAPSIRKASGVTEGLSLAQWRCACRNVIPLLAASRQPHGSGLGRVRYVVERTLAWFSNYRRIKLCYEKCGEHFQALHDLAAALICANKLRLAG